MSDRDDGGESRRQIARRQVRKAGDRSARLANTLMKVAPSVLDKLGLDEGMREAVDRARKVTAQVARRRAERTLAGDLRRVDLVALDGRLATVLETGSAEPQNFHHAEQWRTRLLEGGLAAAEEFPGGAAPPLPKLLAQAQREKATGKPPGAARALFRHIVAVLNAPAAPPKVEHDPDEPADADDAARYADHDRD